MANEHVTCSCDAKANFLSLDKLFKISPLCVAQEAFRMKGILFPLLLLVAVAGVALAKPFPASVSVNLKYPCSINCSDYQD